MIRLARRASLLGAFYLLASAATAYAECAWVLWQQMVMMPTPGRTSGTPPDPFHWNVVNAYETRDACQQGLKPEEERRKRRVEEVEKENREGKTISGIPPLKVVCLPDTVDPRGPKGGAR